MHNDSRLDRRATESEFRALVSRTDEQILRHFPVGFNETDCYGLTVNQEAISKYLKNLHEHTVAVVQQTANWSKGDEVCEIGAGFGNNLIPLKTGLALRSSAST